MKLLILACLTGLVCIAYGQTTEAWNYQQALQALTNSKLSVGDMAKLSQQISAAAKTGTPEEIKQKAIDIIRARIAQQAIPTTVAPGGTPGQNPMIAAAQKAMQAYQQFKQQQAQSGQSGSGDAKTFNIQIQPDSSSSSGFDGSSGIGINPQMLAIKQKFMEYIKSKHPDTSAMMAYYFANYKTQPIKTLLDQFPSFFPKDEQPGIQKLVDQGVANNEKFLDRVEEVAKQDAELVSEAVSILKNTSLTIPEMKEELQDLTAKYEPVIQESVQGLVKPIIVREVVPQMQAAMGGPGTDEVMYADVMPSDNSDQPVSSDVYYEYHQPTIQEDPPVGGKKAAKAAAKAAKKAAKQAAKQAAKEAAKKAAKKAEKAARKAEKAAKKNAE